MPDGTKIFLSKNMHVFVIKMIVLILVISIDIMKHQTKQGIEYLELYKNVCSFMTH